MLFLVSTNQINFCMKKQRIIQMKIAKINFFKSKIQKKRNNNISNIL